MFFSVFKDVSFFRFFYALCFLLLGDRRFAGGVPIRGRLCAHVAGIYSAETEWGAANGGLLSSHLLFARQPQTVHVRERGCSEIQTETASKPHGLLCSQQDFSNLSLR